MLFVEICFYRGEGAFDLGMYLIFEFPSLDDHMIQILAMGTVNELKYCVLVIHQLSRCKSYGKVTVAYCHSLMSDLTITLTQDICSREK